MTDSIRNGGYPNFHADWHLKRIWHSHPQHPDTVMDPDIYALADWHAKPHVHPDKEQR